LLRKHGPALSDLVARQAAIADELDGLSRQEARRSQALEELALARREAETAAEALSQDRQRAAAELAREVTHAFADLSMTGARLEVALAPRPPREGDDPAVVFAGRRLAATGWDRVEFLLAANVGEQARPLARVASGGELSRVMLALKRTLAGSDVTATYVFDEVDTGIGGAVADVVGRLLKGVARAKQVLCVTHLPQIAAYADAHFLVEKRASAGRTSTTITRLAAQARVEELARMVGGARVTAKARAHAGELLEHARQAK
jgi:DNA repair protein RecN (Recombination protein N)